MSTTVDVIVEEQGPPPAGALPLSEVNLGLVLRGGKQLPASVEIEVQRAVAETISSVLSAQMTPRNMADVRRDVLMACGDPELAKQAFWTLPRGDSNLTGPSIRLAEELAHHFGHLDYGLVIHPRHEPGANESVVEAFCWDKQKNNRKTIRFTVPHIRYSKSGSKALKNPGEIYEVIASAGQRRLRDCIFATLPRSVVQSAITACTVTLQRISTNVGGAIAEAVTMFGAQFAVTPAQIETYLGHALTLATEQDVMDLHAIYTQLIEGAAKPEDFFAWSANTHTEPAGATANVAAKPAPVALESPQNTAQTPTEQAVAPTAQDIAPTPAPKKLGGIRRRNAATTAVSANNSSATENSEDAAQTAARASLIADQEEATSTEPTAEDVDPKSSSGVVGASATSPAEAASPSINAGTKPRVPF